MLEFLVTSKARRRLLHLLWNRDHAASASDFAKLARVGFASAYRELRAMQTMGLVLSERHGAAEVYRANPSHPQADTLRALVTPPTNPANEDDRRLRAQLKALGAPLQGHEEQPMRSLEETLVRGVNLAHRDPDVARALPVCFHRHRDQLRADRLHHFARHLGEKRSLGFFLDVTATLSGDRRFTHLTSALHDRRCTASRDFFHAPPRSRRHTRAADLHTPNAARKWGLRMNMDLEAFRSTFEKFANVA